MSQRLCADGLRVPSKSTRLVPCLRSKGYQLLQDWQIGRFNSIRCHEEVTYSWISCGVDSCSLDSCSHLVSRHLNDGSTGLVALLAHGFEDEGRSTRSLVEGRKVVGSWVRTGRGQLPVSTRLSTLGLQFCIVCMLSPLGVGSRFGDFAMSKTRAVRMRGSAPKNLKAANPVAAQNSSWQTAGTAGPCSSVGARRSA